MNEYAKRLAALSPAKRQLLHNMLCAESAAPEPIAIVGLGCRFAGAPDVAAFWRLIRAGRSATGEIPASRWNVDAFYDPKGEAPGKMSNRWGGFLDDVETFDAAFFGISPREAENIDPQQRLLLETAWEALEYGAIAPSSLAGTQTGVFIGIGGFDYSRVPIQMDSYFERINIYSGTGNALSIASNRLSYVLDLHGPSLSVDTACSSSLVAVHLATESLRRGESDLAIVGGCNLILTPETTLAFSKARMLAPDGVCRPFDARAGGYVRGEGCGVVVAKRLADAIADRNRIFAVVRASAVNQDGRTSGITAPNPLLQRAVIRRALAEARLEPEDITYIEAHGTGTPLGDPMELEALCDVFHDPRGDAPPCRVGSVKANIGHAETAAGIAGVIKTVLMLQHGCIPPQAHFETMNPRIHLDQSRLEIDAREASWETDRPRRAGVSSFGFGGTNVHVILEQPPERATESSEAERPLHILPLSAKSRTALTAQADRMRGYLGEHPETHAADFCFSAGAGRSHFPHRMAVVAATSAEFAARLERFAHGQADRQVKQSAGASRARPRIAFLFSGQGSQYPAMGRGLFRSHPVFRDALLRCDRALEGALGCSIVSIMHAPTGADRLRMTRFQQPALFSLQYALAALWRSWGVEPDVVLGHSVGEYAAACVAGVFPPEEAIGLIAERARLMAALPKGAMAVVFAGAQEVAARVDAEGNKVTIAAFNEPKNTVISGPAAAVARLADLFQADGFGMQPLDVSHAFHSPLMTPMLDAFHTAAAVRQGLPPKVPFISSVTGAQIDQSLDADYWCRQIVEPVRFAGAVDALASFAPDIVLEIGPAATTIGMARRSRPGIEPLWLASLRRGRDDWSVVLDSLSAMYVGGAELDWEAFDRPWPRVRLSLPPYPFERKAYWHRGTRRQPQHATPTEGANLHPLLGRELATATASRIFESSLHATAPAFLADHRFHGGAVMAAAGYVELALAAAAEVLGEGPVVIESLAIEQAMTWGGASRAVQTLMAAESSSEYRFEVHSRAAQDSHTNSGREQPWTRHAAGTAHRSGRRGEAEQPAAIDLKSLEGRLPHEADGEAFYRRMADRGLDYGPAFRVLKGLRFGGHTALARLVPPDDDEGRGDDAYQIHPAILDGCLQTLAAVVSDDAEAAAVDVVYLPVFVRRLRLHARPCGAMRVYATRTSAHTERAPETVEADVLLLNEAGEVLVEIEGVRVQRIGRENADDARLPRRPFYTVQWRELGLPPWDDAFPRREDLANVRWLLLSDRQGIAPALAASLRREGAECTVVRAGSGFRFVDGNGSPARCDYEIDPASEDDYRRLLDLWRPASDVRCGVIALWNIDYSPAGAGAPSSDDLRAACSNMLRLVRAITRDDVGGRPAVWTVTRGAQATCPTDPVSVAQAALWGMMRTVTNEHPELAWRLVDLDPCKSPDDSASCLLYELAADASDNQIAWRRGERVAARLERSPSALPEDGEDAAKAACTAGPRRLRFDRPGRFQSLYFERAGRAGPGSGQIEIEVRASGLNFSDVLKVMGLYPGITDPIVPLGIECAGVVSAVGEGVTRFRAGERVMGVAPFSLGTHAVTAEYAVVHPPEALSFEELATIPITFLTAFHALRRLAQLERGESVLIHAGAGGVGLSAIQIAKHCGAEIFTTAGSDRKRDYLRSLGLDHVFDSRSLDFAELIMESTEGRGVDVVLNSLPGRAMEKSLAVLAAYGRFLEIGKTDIYQNRPIGLAPFRDNLSYFAIDLDRMFRQRPEYVQDLFSELMMHFESGDFLPLPITLFPDRETPDAFRYMAQRKNIGKIVISFAEDDSATEEPAARGIGVRSDGTYLVSGGTGALGLQVARRLAEQGAGRVAILARREPSADATAIIERLQREGAKVAVLQADVSDLDSLRGALSSLPTEFPPIRGVVHAAGVLADRLIRDMDSAQFEAAFVPKAIGAWNLHEATVGCPLEHFILFSSIAGVMGPPGQANYAAANAALDGLAHYRRRLGLPCISISWGPWAGAGMAAGAADRLRARGFRPLEPEAGLDFLSRAMAGAPPHVVIADVDWDTLLASEHGIPRRLIESLGSEEAPRATADQRDAAFCTSLRDAPPDDRHAMLHEYLAAAVAGVMETDRQSIDCTQPLALLGLDSLMAVELATKVEAALGIRLPMTALTDNPTVASLTDEILASLETAATPIETTPAKEPTKGPRKSSSPVVRLTDNGRRSPLLCVHPIGGDISCYYPLAGRLDPDHPTWAFRARGLAAAESLPDSIESMTVDYADALAEAAPEGSCYLVGWSTGGIFAYALASQLKTQGSDIGALFLIDSPVPAAFRKVDLNDDALFLFEMVRFSNWFAGKEMQIAYHDLKSLDTDAALRKVLAEATSHGVLPTDASIESLKRRLDVCRAHVRAIVDYVPRPLESPVHLIRPSDRSALDDPLGGDTRDDLGWSGVLGRTPILNEAPGDHFSMLRGRGLTAIARHITEPIRSSGEPTAV